MIQCPICQHTFPEPLPLFCHQCGWDFQHDPTLTDPQEDISPEGFEAYQQRKNIVRGLWEERLLLKTKYQNMQADLNQLRTKRENWSEMRISDDIDEVEPMKNLEIEMVLIKGGRFMMGSNVKEDEMPVHKVELDDFYLGKYQVTQDQWKAIMGNNPSKLRSRGDLPVEWISWYDVQEFLLHLQEKTGKPYRLPTEAEWEYACRAGSTTRFCYGDNEDGLVEYAWFDRNSGFESHPVGQKKPNAWGLYDMHGNVFEWCQDWYYRDFYQESPKHNPICQKDSRGHRVVRGGGWSDKAAYCRSSDRLGRSPEARSYHIGLRLALDASDKPD